MSSGANAQAGKSQTAYRCIAVSQTLVRIRRTCVLYLAVTEQLIPLLLLKGLAAKVLAFDGIDPHVIIARIYHEVEHAARGVSMIHCRLLGKPY